MIELNSEIVVEDLDDKQRLDVFLAAETGWTRSQIKLQVDSKRVSVNGNNSAMHNLYYSCRVNLRLHICDGEQKGSLWYNYKIVDKHIHGSNGHLSLDQSKIS